MADATTTPAFFADPVEDQVIPETVPDATLVSERPPDPGTPSSEHVAGEDARSTQPSGESPETASCSPPELSDAPKPERGPKPPNPFAANADYLGPISATPHKMVSIMLRIAEVDENSVVLDLGCNDGRVPVAAAREFGCTGLGVEIDSSAVQKAKTMAEQSGVSDKVTILHGNAVRVPKSLLARATVVFAYLLPTGNRKMSMRLLRELRPGTIVVTYVFRLPKDEWDGYLVRVESVSSTRDRPTKGVDTGSFNKMFKYRVPLEKPRGCRSSVGETRSEALTEPLSAARSLGTG
jgi:predicted O-methyltransferase YrrM